MKIEKLFVSVNARDFAGLSEWYATLLGRRWDAEPMPTCHEWNLGGVLFQVLDNADGAKTAVTLLIDGLDAELDRLRAAGIAVEAAAKVPGFETLRYASFADPEGNPVGLLEGR